MDLSRILIEVDIQTANRLKKHKNIQGAIQKACVDVVQMLFDNSEKPTISWRGLVVVNVPYCAVTFNVIPTKHRMAIRDEFEREVRKQLEEVKQKFPNVFLADTSLTIDVVMK